MIGLFAALYQHFFAPTPLPSVSWEEPDTAPFTELILSWNAKRPTAGRLTFLVSLKQEDEWSPWLYIGEWGYDGQMLFTDEPKGTVAKVRRGIATSPTKGVQGFRILTLATGGAELNGLRLSVATGSSREPDEAAPMESLLLPNLQRQSQITLRHSRYLDLALPTSMSVAVNTILGAKSVDGSDFAANVYDGDFDCYEEWPLSVAEAANRLGEKIAVRTERLANFRALYAHLLDGFPVVVSLKGTLPGSPRPFYTPHAVCVVGFDALEQKVLCIDSLFPNDRATLIGYPLSEFCRTWALQGNIAAVFERVSH